ncbi:MAG: ABC transporter permease [Bacteroidota bacterium]
MFSNYLKIAYRNLRNNKLYSSINILGLAIGLSISMLILLFVVHELSFDRFHANNDRIHKMKLKAFFGEQEINTTVLSAGFAPIVSERLPEVEDAVRVCAQKQIIFKSDDEHIFSEKNLLLADPNILEVFSFKLLEGNAATALSEPQTLVLTRPIAEKYFGTQNPIGRTLIYEDELPFKVTGIIEEPPSNSTIKFDFIASLNSLNAIQRLEAENPEKVSLSLDYQKMGLGQFETYLLLSPQANISEVIDKVTALQAEDESFTMNVKYFTDALPDLHLGKQAAKRIYLFLGIALLILGLALINYISLSTARAVQRSKEVAIRKVIGATRRKLIVQFYTDSILLIALSFLIGFGLIWFFQPFFYNLLDLKIDRQFIYHPLILLLYGGLLLVAILFSGSLPAFLMSAYRPVNVLKGKIKSGKSGNRLRQGFTVFSLQRLPH